MMQKPQTTHRDAHVAGIILAGIAFYCSTFTTGIITLILTNHTQAIPHLATALAIITWLPAGILIFREIYNATTTTIITHQPEVIRFIRVQNDNLVDWRDLAYFLVHIEITGQTGKNSIRGLPFPSGKRGSDTYHTTLTQPLIDAGLWEPAQGPGHRPRLKVTPQEALDILGLPRPPYPIFPATPRRPTPIDR